MTTQPFTRWQREIDGPALVLVTEQGGRISEWLELDIRDLHRRADLLARLGPVSRERLLAEARAYG